MIPIRRASGLPDDSREAAERDIEWRLRDLRGRVKVVRAVIAGSAGLRERLASDWRKASWFYMRFGITEGMLRSGVPSSEVPGENLLDVLRTLCGGMTEVRARVSKVLPGCEGD